MRQALVGIVCFIVGCSSFGSEETASPSGLDAGGDASLGADAAMSGDAGGTGVLTDGGASPLGRIVFVTSGKYAGNLGGLEGADAKCAAEASGASLSGTYRAWVSVSAQPAGARVRGDSGPFVRTDGTRIAATLTAPPLEAPIDHDAHGGAVSVSPLNVWTGTTGAGNVASATCADWSSAAASDTGVAGLITGIKTDNWTSNTQAADCDNSYRLYCVQD